MFKGIIVAVMAIAASIGFAGSANAVDSSGFIDTTTYSNGTTYVHHLAADYTCGTDLTGKTVIGITLATGTGILTPNTAGGGAFAFSGTSGNYSWTYGGTYDANGVWTSAGASAGFDFNMTELYNFGTTGQTADQFGSVVGSFTNIPNCATPEVPTTGNHGECVSGAAHAGVKGKALAEIAKVVTKVGAYGSYYCPAV